MKQHKGEAIRLALFLAASFAVFLYLYQLSGGKLVPGSNGYRVEAIVPDALGLAKNADVRQAGVRVGRVVDSRNLGPTTALMIELQDDHAPIYRDATVLVRTKSAAGENYLELDPGHLRRGSIADGGRLPIDRAKEATQLDDVLSVLDAKRRRQLQRALRGLGGGLNNHGGDLNRTFESTAATVRSSADLSAMLAADRRQVASLVDSLGRVTRALGERKTAIGVLVRQGKVSAEAVNARNEQFNQTLRELPGFLTQTRATAARLRTFSGSATPVVRDLRLALRDLTPAVEDLRAAAPAGRRVVRELLPFAKAVRKPVAQLRPFSNAAASAIPHLASTLREANPALKHLEPYWKELPNTLALMGGATKYTDSIGHLGRLAIAVSRASFPGTLPLDQLAILQQLEQQVGGDVNTLGYNHFPAPGEAGVSKPFTGEYPRLTAEPSYTSGAAR